MDQKLEKRQIKDSDGKIERLSKPRISPLEGEWHKSIRTEQIGYDQAGGGSSINIFKTIASHPKLMKNWSPFLSYIGNRTRLPKRDREIVILRIGWLCQTEYIWGQHAIVAKEVGLSDEEIKRITKGPDAEGWSEFESTLIQAVDELYLNTFIGDKTWKLLSEKYNDRKLMDFICTVGEYNHISMFLNTVGVQLEEDKMGFPE